MSRRRRREGSALRGFSVSFRHLARLTDDTGVMEHALGRIPRRGEGYTTDDNARALWACVEAIDACGGRGGPDAFRLFRLADRYLAFLAWAQRPNGLFHNNFRYDRTPEAETPSDDCFARALWACAVACVRLADEDRAFAAADMVRRALPRVPELAHPRGWAYALAACCLLLEDGWLRGARSPWREREDELYELIKRLEKRLISRFRECSAPGWAWFEPVMTYDNGVLPWALFAAYRVTGSRGALDTVRASLRKASRVRGREISSTIGDPLHTRRVPLYLQRADDGNRACAHPRCRAGDRPMNALHRERLRRRGRRVRSSYRVADAVW